MKRMMRRCLATPLALGLLGIVSVAPAMADDCDPPPEPSGCVSYYGSVENRYIPCLYTDQNAWRGESQGVLPGTDHRGALAALGTPRPVAVRTATRRTR
jgi:hypothetical protein